MTVCEYFGLPGSGKTTLMMATKTDKDAPAYYVNGALLREDARRVPAARKVFNALLGHPVSLYFRTRRFVKKYRLGGAVKPFIRSTRVLCLNMAGWERAGKSAVVVNDNGFAQILVSILKRIGTQDVETFVRDYLDSFFRCPFGYRFIYVEAPVEECFKRIVQRGKALSITRQGTDTLNELRREKALFDAVEKALHAYFQTNGRVLLEREDNS